MLALTLLAIVFLGSWFIAARARERGQCPSQCVRLLVGLSMIGAVAFGGVALIVSCGLWGFDLHPRWERHFLRAAVVAGALGGVAVAFLIARRTDPRRVAERRAVEADYDDPESPGPPAGPAPPP